MRRVFGLPLVPLLLLACQDATIPATSPSDARFNQSAAATSAAGVIPGQFVVTLHAGADPAAVARAHGVEPRYVYRNALNGFAGGISDAARDGLLRDSRVARIEPDAMAYPGTTVQSGATWGLDRIDQRSLPLSGTYTYSRTGAGVTAYIIDSGIRYSHSEFGGRAKLGRDFVAEEDPANAGGGGGTDCNGHGTHVAGTVGGNLYGVAKGVTLVSVRVFGCSGGAPYSRVIAAVDWVTANAAKPAVVNMSLGGPTHLATDAAVRNSIASGISYAVSAGNDSQDACRATPARVREAMTIGSTVRDDSRSSFSNVGDCVDWFAPGSSITSAWATSNTDTRTISGTSMAAPHTAGAAALFLEANPTATPAQVYTGLYDLTTKGIVTKARSKNNHLLYSLGEGGGGGGGGGGGDGGDTGGGGTPPGDEDPGTPAAVTLAVRGYKVTGRLHADLRWSGATSAQVNVWRQAGTGGTWQVHTVRPNDHTGENIYTDSTGFVGGGTLSYQICETESARNDLSKCSDVKSWTF
jgi:subtilisin family serine protease